MTASSSSTDPRPHREDALYRDLSARLFAQNRFAVKLGLERMRAALDRVGAPDRAMRCVIVAGTNGKGTTASLLAALLAQAQHTTGLYTSPHLLDVRERFRVNGWPVTPQEVLEVGSAALAAFGGLDDLPPDLLAFGAQAAARLGWPAPDDLPPDQRLTFFELTTLMALVLFQRRGVTTAVLEVGLGGRLDAVNAVEPDLTVITTLGYDHQAYLGDTLTQIAREKAGTLRPHKPALLASPQPPEAMAALLEVALRLPARLLPLRPAPAPLPAWLQGDFATNARLAWSAALALEPHLPDTLWADTLAIYRWPARRERVTLGPTPDLRGPWLLDAAHNPAGAQTLAAWLHTLPTPTPVGLLGAMQDKDVEGLCAALAPHLPAWIVTRALTERAAPPERLAAALAAHGAPHVEIAPLLPEALLRAREIARDQPALICGSLYLLGDALHILQPDEAWLSTWRRGD